MSTSTSIERLRQALRPIDDDGMSHGGPDGWQAEPNEIREWEETFREAADPTTIRALLDELDALRAANAELLDQMHHFANADQRLWDESQRDPESFKSWVRSRAAHLLAKFNTKGTK